MSVDSTSMIRSFREQFGRDPEVLAVAPGRVNLIGEHTDYNGGLVLPMAIDRTVAVAAARGDRKAARLYSADFDARDEWRIDAPRRTGRREWRDYARGVAWALLDAGHELAGVELAIAGDVPLGAGLSSSAAFELAFAGAMCEVAGIRMELEQLALLCQKAESQFVGVQCGIMDQLASACSRSGHALLIDCRSLEVENIPLPESTAVVIVDSKRRRALADTAYNERRQECAAAARALGIDSLRDAAEDELEHLPEPLRRRARHVATENGRVRDAVAALQSGEERRFGQLMYESHASLREDFEVSTVELDLLVDLASRTEGVIGARLTGAGFGGCTVNLVHREAVAQFETGVIIPYRQKTGLPANIFVCRSVDGLRVTRA